jgi:hypothetical protein
MKTLLITPPLTQLNTPYPATAYLTSSLKQNGFEVIQSDIGIELINLLFTKENLSLAFDNGKNTISRKLSKQTMQIYENRNRYISTIDHVMNFLRGNDNTLAQRICTREFLPEGNRFKDLHDLDWAFGVMGQQDMAKYFATLYIEDLTDFINETIDKHFGLNRYAEKLCSYISDFKEVERQVNAIPNLLDKLTIELLQHKIEEFKPNLVGFSIPFPGNFLSALKMGKYIKTNHSAIKVVLGGGFVNTELRWLDEPAVFKYTDFVILDDGKYSLEQLCNYISKKASKTSLIRTFCIEKSTVKFFNNGNKNVEKWQNVCPDFSGLPFGKYISMIETTNPLAKIWSDGQWNKMIMANGCYWANCAFCDTSLPYIKDYSPYKATELVDNMEKVMAQTGQSGFHFVDEAAPPKLIREVSTEIIKRNLVVSWWGNIRFEKAFNEEMCQLMANSGCIAVSGGLESASDRLLKLMNKGVTIEQVAKATHYFTSAGIMVHTYLIYGFPTQTIQETVDSLEVVRQFFEEGLIQSAFWHRYIMTVHSPTGRHPENYNARIVNANAHSFAKNDIDFEDDTNVDLDMVGKALKKSMFNYMQGIGYEIPVHKWFTDKVPKTKVKKDLIKSYILKITSL